MQTNAKHISWRQILMEHHVLINKWSACNRITIYLLDLVRLPLRLKSDNFRSPCSCTRKSIQAGQPCFPRQAVRCKLARNAQLAHLAAVVLLVIKKQHVLEPYIGCLLEILHRGITNTDYGFRMSKGSVTSTLGAQTIAQDILRLQNQQEYQMMISWGGACKSMYACRSLVQKKEIS